MPFRIRAILILMFIFFCYLLFFEKNFQSTDEKLSNNNQLVSFQRGELIEIDFDNISLIKNNDSFRLKTPISHIASNENCGNIFREFEKIISISKADTIISEDIFLSNIRKIIKLIDKNSSKTLLIGQPVPDKKLKECYAKLEKQTGIFIIKEELFDLLNHPLNFYMDSKPFEFIEKGNIEISWNNGKNKYSLKRINDNFFISENNECIWSADTRKCKSFFSIIEKLDFSDTSYEIINDEIEADLQVKIRSEKFVKNMSFFSNKQNSNQCYLKFEEKGIAFQVPLKLKDLFKTDFITYVAPNVFEGVITNLYKVSMEIPKKNTIYKFYGSETIWTIDHPYRWLFSSGKILNFLLKVSIQETHNWKERNIIESPFLIFDFEYQNTETPNEKLFFYKKIDSDEIVIGKNWTKTSAIVKNDLFKEFDFDPFMFTDSRPFSKIIDASNYLIIKNKSSIYKFKKNEFGKWFYDKSFIQKENINIQNLLTSLTDSKCYSAMNKKEGVDFGFENPIFELTFSNVESDFNFEIKVGSYSNEKDSFLICNNEFFLFFKELLLFKEFKINETSGGNNANV